MACRAEKIGVTKAKLDFVSTFMLAILAGLFMRLVHVSRLLQALYRFVIWLSRLVAGLTFSLGLILVVEGGAELFNWKHSHCDSVHKPKSKFRPLDTQTGPL